LSNDATPSVEVTWPGAIRRREIEPTRGPIDLRRIAASCRRGETRRRRLRHAITPTDARPTPIDSIDAGSGTATSLVKLEVVLNPAR
jgi:hypothetical protein